MNILIPAAGSNHSRILPFSESLPDALIPLNGKPVLDYILEELGRHDLKNISIIVNPGDEARFGRIRRKYDKAASIKVIPVQGGRHLLDTLAAAEAHSCKDEGIFIILSDTIFKSQLDFSRSTVYYRLTEDIFRWCIVESSSDGSVLRLIDKPVSYGSKPRALVGLYYFSDSKLFFKCLEAARKEGKHEISSVVEKMMLAGHKIYTKECDEWIDCGSVDNYYRAKRRLLQSRHFNTVTVDELFNIISKSSKNAEKLEAEYGWYSGLPLPIQSFTPRVFSFSKSPRPTLQLEYYGHPSLSEYFVYTFIPIDIWNSVFDHIFGMLGVFRSYAGELGPEDFSRVYLEKTLERVKMLRSSSKYWRDWLDCEQFTINGKICPGWPKIMKLIENTDFYSKKDVSIIHGDLCFTNILYDLNGHTLKIIDPRGSFGKRGIYGDTKYDLAKLRHSTHGRYDFIINDLFNISEDGSVFNYEIFSSDWANGVSKSLDSRIEQMGYDIKTIQTIEAILFFTMIPLHSDKPLRQKMMGVRALELFREVCNENSD